LLKRLREQRELQRLKEEEERMLKEEEERKHQEWVEECKKKHEEKKRLENEARRAKRGQSAKALPRQRSQFVVENPYQNVQQHSPQQIGTNMNSSWNQNAKYNLVNMSNSAAGLTTTGFSESKGSSGKAVNLKIVHGVQRS